MAVERKVIIIAGPNGAGRRNFTKVYAPAVDAWALYDNSGPQPVLLNWSEKP